MLKSLILVNLLVSYCTISFCLKQNPEDWVDPHDMLSFNPVLKKNIQSSITEKVADEKRDLNIQNINVKDFQQCPKCPNCSSHINGKQKHFSSNEKDFLFIKRFLAFYTRKIKKVWLPGDDVQYQVTVQVSKEAWTIFDQFNAGSNQVSLQEILQHLEKTFVQFSVVGRNQELSWKWKFEDYFHVTLNDACMVFVLLLLLFAILTTEILSKVSWTKQFARLVCLMFFFSYLWTYARQYQEAVAKHKASFVGVPDYCKNSEHQMNMVEEISYIFQNMFSTKKDPCTSYHESYLIKPIFTISPIKVLAATLSEFLLEPFRHMGSTFSVTFRNMFSELPAQLWIPAFIFVIVVMVGFLMFISVCLGYSWKLNLPFWSGFEILPSQNALQTRHHEELTQNLRSQIEDLQKQVARLQESQLHAICGPPNQTDDSWFAPLWRLFGSEEAHNSKSRADASSEINELNSGFVSDFPSNDRSPDNIRRRRKNSDSVSDVPQTKTSFDSLYFGNSISNLPYPENSSFDSPYPTNSSSVLPYPRNSPDPPYPQNFPVGTYHKHFSSNRCTRSPSNESHAAFPRSFSLPAPEITSSPENPNQASISEMPAPKNENDENRNENSNQVTEIGFKRSVAGVDPQIPLYEQVAFSNSEQNSPLQNPVHFVTDQSARQRAFTPDKECETLKGANESSSILDGEKLKSKVE